MKKMTGWITPMIQCQNNEKIQEKIHAKGTQGVVLEVPEMTQGVLGKIFTLLFFKSREIIVFYVGIVRTFLFKFFKFWATVLAQILQQSRLEQHFAQKSTFWAKFLIITVIFGSNLNKTASKKLFVLLEQRCSICAAGTVFLSLLKDPSKLILK